MYDAGDLRVFDPILTGFALGYNEQNLHGEELMPITRVNHQSGRYRIFDRSGWVIFPDRREQATVANEVRGGKWSLDTYKVVEHSLQSFITDEEREEIALSRAFDEGEGLNLDPERDATQLVTRSILLRHEKMVADTIRNSANYPGDHVVTLAGAQQFDDYTGGEASTSNPVAVIRAAVRKIRAKTGTSPNLMAIPTDGVGYMEEHPRVVARFTNFNLMDAEAWRRLTGFEGRIIFVESVYNAANNIDAPESIVNLWGKDIWIGVVDVQEGMFTRTFGKTFVRPYGDQIRPTDRWREEPRKVDVVRVSQRYDVKIVSNIAGYLIKNAFSAAAF